MTVEATFKLSKPFVARYKEMRAPFGFGGLGELVFRRTYSRIKPNGKNEAWFETVERVVTGCYRLQERHIKAHNLGWDARKAQKSAQEMYDRMFTMKFLPPGRGLWAMGTELTESRGLFAALNNCGFTSTEHIDEEGAEPFAWLMDASMLGIGVGFDNRGAGKVVVQAPGAASFYLHRIDDTREGWVDSVRCLINAYLCRGSLPHFDYSLIRAAGEPIKGFGGVASGPEPLRQLHADLRGVLEKNAGAPITVRTIVDICNLIGRCVVAGNVRRTALITFGEADDEEYLRLKDYWWNAEKNDWDGPAAERAAWGWTSNNSVFCELGMNYARCAEQTAVNGEPGYVWLGNMRNYGRMADGMNPVDHRVAGANPCFSGDTLIAVADGRGAVSLASLAESGNDVPVYSVTPEGEVEIRWARHPRKTRTGANLVRVILDDGTHLDVTPDHKMLLLDGSPRAASELQPGDSLPRFTKYAGHGLNNDPRNLEIVTYREHGQIHAGDRCGSENGMWGRQHTEETRALIGARSRERWADPDWAAFVKSRAHTEETRKGHAERLGRIRRENMSAYYQAQAATTDLQTVWVDGNLFALRNCRICGVEMQLRWGRRQVEFCSRSCVNRHDAHSAARRAGLRARYADTQQGVLQQQVIRYKDLEQSLGRPPLKKEWEACCRQSGVSFRLNPHSVNPHVLPNFAELRVRAASYNHRVMSVTPLPGTHDVYNLTVDENHTVGVVTEFEPQTMQCHGIFTPQCTEQSLEHGELCCLVEVFINNHESLEEFRRTLKFAYLYAKTVTLGQTHWPLTNRVMLRNRRIGASLAGIQQFIARHDLHTFKEWCEDGYQTIGRYDRVYSDWFAIPQSIKKTSVKPGGTVPLLAGATPGMHWPHALHYLRRIRLSVNSELVAPLVAAGYSIEPCVGQEDSTVVVAVPVKLDSYGGKLRTVAEVPMWEQVTMAAFMQRYWADNQVSVSVSFDPETEGPEIAHALDYLQYDMKGISFLPVARKGPEIKYPQAPYETISEAEYEALAARLKPLDFSAMGGEESEQERFCDGESCTL